MSKVITRLLLIPIVGILMIAVPTVSQAVTITSVTVTAGGSTFSGCETAATCTNKIWDLGATGTALTASGNTALILTQAQLEQAFDFDVSDVAGSSAISAVIQIVTDLGTITFTDTKQILTKSNANDPGGQHQEAADWVLSDVDTTTGLQVSLGYADNAHTGIGSDPKGTACADGDGDCLPGNGTSGSPWQGTANTVFDGSAVGPEPTSICSRTGITSCYDSGAILVQLIPTPEPSPLLLLGTALLGMSFVIQRQYKVKKSLRS